MPVIERFEIMAVDLPFRFSFKHAAAERRGSSSIFLRCQTDTGVVGFGESLPRPYVTGETQAGVVELLRDRVLPHLVGRSFEKMEDVFAFLRSCDGKAPQAWAPTTVAQCAAWATVDLALLDTFGKAFGTPVRLNEQTALPPKLRYSGVQSSSLGFLFFLTLLNYRLFGIHQIKLKVEGEGYVQAAQWVRRIMGQSFDLRTDANMAWNVEQAIAAMNQLAAYGIHMFEQPIAAADLEGLARVVRETGVGVMADESLNDRGSLDRLIAQQACTAINVRISKCGGLVASYNRCRQALDAGLTLQVGCQVGESSVLSAAQLLLLAAVQDVTYAEGCFGHRLLNHDPASPLLQFGYGGRPPALPTAPGLGVIIDEAVLRQATSDTFEVKSPAIFH